MNYIPIAEWKLKYGRVFKVRLENKDIYFRLLSVGEIDAYKTNPSLLSKSLSSIILNNESLSSAGAQYKLSDFVINNSFPNNDDELKEKILHNRFKVKDEFSLSLIAKLCSIYISYTPDQLKHKTIDQLLELIAIAELITGKPLLNNKAAKPGTLNQNRSVVENDGGRFSKPPVDELMEESTDALQQAMRKEGKKVQTLNEIKSKQNKPNLTDLQKQMKELNQVI